MKLRSSVVLDQASMSVSSQFGATGTPIAVLVDAEGKIASVLVHLGRKTFEITHRREDRETST
jgi:hypothetical protein